MRAENFLVSVMLENGARVYPCQSAYVGLSNAGKCGCGECGQLNHSCDRSQDKKPRPICDCCPGD